jgi:TonB family protein
MRFTIGLRRKTVKGEAGKNPVFLPKTGFFYWIRNMVGNSHLKIAASVSLGIHLVLLGITSALFQESKILRRPNHYVKVTLLLPLVTKEKPDTKIVLPVPLKVGNQDREQPVFDLKGLNQESRLSPKSIEDNTSLEEPKPNSKDKEEEKTSDEQMSVAMAPGSVTETDSNVKNDGNMVFSGEATLSGGNLSISLPSSHSGERHGSSLSYRNSGDGQGAGAGPGNGSPGNGGHGNGGPGNGGPGKGKEILGKFFNARKGGNGARPSYAENPKPIYPQEAREKGCEGEVILRVEVLSNGRVGQIEVRKSSGHELLDRSALTTVKQWRFIPATKGDMAIPLWVNVPIKFQLQ